MAYRWDERYDQENFIFGTEPNDFLKQEAYRIPTGGKVLCLGDGEGRNGVWLAEQGFQVTSVDLSQVGLDKTQRFADQRGVQIETIYADLAEWHIEPQAWDGIVSIFCHMMPDERKKCTRGSSKACNPAEFSSSKPIRLTRSIMAPAAHPTPTSSSQQKISHQSSRASIFNSHTILKEMSSKELVILDWRA